MHQRREGEKDHRNRRRPGEGGLEAGDRPAGGEEQRCAAKGRRAPSVTTKGGALRRVIGSPANGRGRGRRRLRPARPATIHSRPRPALADGETFLHAALGDGAGDKPGESSPIARSSTPVPPPSRSPRRRRCTATATPRFRPRARSAPISVTRMRAPEAPIGWPSAQAPPLTLTFSWRRPRSRIAAIATTAKASLISKRSTDSLLQPVLSNRTLRAADRRGREVFWRGRVGSVRRRSWRAARRPASPPRSRAS